MAALAADLIWRADQASTARGFATEVVAAAAEVLGADFTAIASGRAGAWSVAARFGTTRPLPTELMADVADHEQAAEFENWVAAPLGRTGDVIVAHAAGRNRAAQILGDVELLSVIVDTALQIARNREQHHRRVERLESILRIAALWNQATEMEPLLEQMAQAATRLLEADRASIFLWDRSNHTLVGRPALGVAGGELRIPDDAGVVGQVIRTGESRRIDAKQDQGEINRQVDRQLGYETRTLLAVPLRGSRGELFGVFEVINKLQGNFSSEDEAALSELAQHAGIALENTRQLEELITTNRQIIEQAAQGVQLVGESPAIEALRSTVRRVAGTELALLILGENGTGKEVVSQSVHYLSRRRNQPFIAVNCAAISESLLESELFGHEKGAFTDAHEMRQGKFELASGGTLFLDEIGDLSLSGQAKLLRVLEEKVVVRVGGSKPIHTDARVIAATNQNLAEMVRQKRFRQDLYFRLNVVTLDLPALRDRGEDVLRLAEHFLADFCRKAHRKTLKLSAGARKRLLMHAWPGNVRELRNLTERLAYLHPGDCIEAEDVAFILSPGDQQSPLVDPDLPLADATDHFQIEFIKKSIERARGNMSEAAERLGLHRSNLYRKMRQLGMQTSEPSE